MSVGGRVFGVQQMQVPGKPKKEARCIYKEAEKPETISVTEEKRKKQQRVLFILMKNCRYIFFKSYL